METHDHVMSPGEWRENTVMSTADLARVKTNRSVPSGTYPTGQMRNMEGATYPTFQDVERGGAGDV